MSGSMASLNWICPHCERGVTISSGGISENTHLLRLDNREGPRILKRSFVVCPNPECRRFTLWAELYTAIYRGERWDTGEKVQVWPLIPAVKAKTFPPYIPEAILNDYREACLIRDLSPKASATLSRRCLQGIIRDFWKVKPGRLVDEIREIESKTAPETWQAIDAVRKIGNIGAHMEKDVDVIVDVDPREAELLIQLIEDLLKDWYVTREDRKSRTAALIEAAANKKP